MNRFNGLILICLLSIFCVGSCTLMQPTHPTGLQQSRQILNQSVASNNCRFGSQRREVPSAVNSALMPAMVSNATTLESEKRFDVIVTNVPAKTFFMGLVEGTKLNMVVAPDVSGTISLDLKNVTIDETLYAIRDTYGYDFRRTAYGYEVLPPSLQTRMFTVNYLNVRRIGKTETELTTGQISENIGSQSSGATGGIPIPVSNSTNSQVPVASKVTTRSRMDFWKELSSTLKAIIGTENGRSVVVNPEAGLVVVHAMPAELREVSRYLQSLQNNMQRQVILDAKIIEVQLDDNYQAGIDWSALGTPSNNNQAGIGQNGIVNLTGQQVQNFLGTDIAPNFNGFFALNIKSTDFNVLIRLLETQGNVQVLSSPRLSTINNQKAVIKVGDDQFFVTAVSTSNTVIGNSTTPTQDVTLTPFFSGVTLDVTPQIGTNDVITLHIHPSVSKVTDQTKTLQLGTTQNNTPNTLVLPLAKSTIRESDNIVHARNGQVIVIGGLMQNQTQEQTASTPWLTRLPFFGGFFRDTLQRSTKSELVILLRVTVVNRTQDWNNDMCATDRRICNMDRGFHVGGLPEVFGNMAEEPKYMEGEECT